MARLSLQPTRVLRAVEGDDDAALLVRCDSALAAVLVKLGAIHGDEEGWWYLEAGFGPCAARPPTFKRLSAALRWVGERCQLDGEELDTSLLELTPQTRT